jgi:CxxC motif-containing protein (DUF1111 family)
VWDAEHERFATGRMGWKAEQPSVRTQTAGAFVGDMGITSAIFAHENHSAGEGACAEQPSGGTPELTPDVLDAVVSYVRTLAVPARRNASDAQVRRGEALFAQARCDGCHLATLHSEHPDAPEVHAYTDLLLHDMGDDLSDARPSFEAEGDEWRTPPLWGIGLVPLVNGHSSFLHDGRARDLTEAVLWHGGESAAAQAAFRNMTKQQRADLLAFLESL